MGRNKLSIEQKKLQGTYKPGRDTEPQAVTPLSRMPPVSDWICDEGKRTWREQGANLIRAGLLTDEDIPFFARFCHFTGMFEKLTAEMANESIVVTLNNGVTAPNPKHKIALDFHKEAEKLGKQFGFSPATRKNVPLPPAVEPLSEFDKLFGR